MDDITRDRGSATATKEATPPGAGMLDLRAYCDHNSRMRESAEISRISPALVRVQAAIENPPRNRQVQVRTQAGAYSFRYATLDRIIDLTRRVLAENGLCVLQPIIGTERGPALLTRLLHESGEWMECEVGLPSVGGNPQAFGSVVTYVRRYALCAMLNIAADEDDDANRAAGNHYADRPLRGGAELPLREGADRPLRDGTASRERGPAAAPAPQEIGEVVGEAVARVLVNRARLAEGVAEGHALLEDWTRRMAVLEQLRGTSAWDALEREIGSGLKRSLGTEPAAAFVAALRATSSDHIQTLQEHWEGKWAETLGAMQAEAPATYALLRRHVAAQIARVRSAQINDVRSAQIEDVPGGQIARARSAQIKDVRGGQAVQAHGATDGTAAQAGEAKASEAKASEAKSAPAPAPRATAQGSREGGFVGLLRDAEGQVMSDPIADPVGFAQAYAEAWHATEPEARGRLARQNVKALGQAARHAPAREVLNALGTERAEA